MFATPISRQRRSGAMKLALGWSAMLVWTSDARSGPRLAHMPEPAPWNPRSLASLLEMDSFTRESKLSLAREASYGPEGRTALLHADHHAHHPTLSKAQSTAQHQSAAARQPPQSFARQPRQSFVARAPRLPPRSSSPELPLGASAGSRLLMRSTRTRTLKSLRGGGTRLTMSSPGDSSDKCTDLVGSSLVGSSLVGSSLVGSSLVGSSVGSTSASSIFVICASILKNAVGIGIFALSGVIATGVSPLQVVRLLFADTPPFSPICRTPFPPYVRN